MSDTNQEVRRHMQDASTYIERAVLGAEGCAFMIPTTVGVSSLIPLLAELHTGSGYLQNSYLQDVGYAFGAGILLYYGAKAYGVRKLFKKAGAELLQAVPKAIEPARNALEAMSYRMDNIFTNYVRATLGLSVANAMAVPILQDAFLDPRLFPILAKASVCLGGATMAVLGRRWMYKDGGKMQQDLDRLDLALSPSLPVQKPSRSRRPDLRLVK
jgi:hypothetical protein